MKEKYTLCRDLVPGSFPQFSLHPVALESKLLYLINSYIIRVLQKMQEPRSAISFLLYRKPENNFKKLSLMWKLQELGKNCWVEAFPNTDLLMCKLAVQVSKCLYSLGSISAVPPRGSKGWAESRQ